MVFPHASPFTDVSREVELMRLSRPWPHDMEMNLQQILSPMYDIDLPAKAWGDHLVLTVQKCLWDCQSGVVSRKGIEVSQTELLKFSARQKCRLGALERMTSSGHALWEEALYRCQTHYDHHKGNHGFDQAETTLIHTVPLIQNDMEESTRKFPFPTRSLIRSAPSPLAGEGWDGGEARRFL